MLKEEIKFYMIAGAITAAAIFILVKFSKQIGSALGAAAVDLPANIILGAANAIEDPIFEFTQPLSDVLMIDQTPNEQALNDYWNIQKTQVIK